MGIKSNFTEQAAPHVLEPSQIGTSGFTFTCGPIPMENAERQAMHNAAPKTKIFFFINTSDNKTFLFC
jgi:hypothetical protein